MILDHLHTMLDAHTGEAWWLTQGAVSLGIVRTEDGVACFDMHGGAMELVHALPLLIHMDEAKLTHAELPKIHGASIELDQLSARISWGALAYDGSSPLMIAPFSLTSHGPRDTALWHVEVASDTEVHRSSMRDATRSVQADDFRIARVRQMWRSLDRGAWPLGQAQQWRYHDVSAHLSVVNRFIGPSPQLCHLLAVWWFTANAHATRIPLIAMAATGKFEEGILKPVNNPAHKIAAFETWCVHHDIKRAVFFVEQESYADGPPSMPHVLFDRAHPELLAAITQPTVVGIYADQVPDLLEALDHLFIESKSRRKRPYMALAALMLAMVVILVSTCVVKGDRSFLVTAPETPHNGWATPENPNVSKGQGNSTKAQDKTTSLEALSNSPKGQMKRKRMEQLHHPGIKRVITHDKKEGGMVPTTLHPPDDLVEP